MKRVTLLCLLFVSGCVSLDDLVHEPPTRSVGAPAPDLELPLLEGGQLELWGLRPRPVVVKFWASYCGACGRSAEEFTRRQAELTEAGRVALVSVSLDTDREAARRAAKRWGLDAAPVVFFGEGYDEDPAKLAFGVRSIPEVFLLGADGRIAAHGRQIDLRAALAADDES